ncbi:hypothetical protein AVEN_186865-1 [Araneus ventricosus]|uniref:Uncharacterized protein n=1 Tax=Araneus ventricosus TaxID=182803 RepID=A0A4Y2X2F3_ARAVE|nr:hypothetical protein AVEN_186865-1 [Araneus ventricosus]
MLEDCVWSERNLVNTKYYYSNPRCSNCRKFISNDAVKANMYLALFNLLMSLSSHRAAMCDICNTLLNFLMSLSSPRSAMCGICNTLFNLLMEGQHRPYNTQGNVLYFLWKFELRSCVSEVWAFEGMKL